MQKLETMTPILTFAQLTTYEFTPPTDRLPSFLWTTFITFNKIHGIWRWYRRIELYRNKDNLAQLLAGHLVNLVLGDRLMLRVAAQCLLISTRILECTKQQSQLHHAYQHWKEAIYGRYPVPTKHSWNRLHKNIWSSPSSEDWLRIKLRSFRYRVERILSCTAVIFIHFLKLNMCIMDTIDAFCLSPHSRNEAINESFLNTMKWLDDLVENKERLLTGIKSNRKIIERILRGSPITYTQLYTNVEKTLEKTEIAYQKAKKISGFTNQLLIDLGKRMLSGSLVMTGFSNYRPSILATF